MRYIFIHGWYFQASHISWIAGWNTNSTVYFVPMFLDHQTCQKPPGGFDRSCQGSGGGQRVAKMMSLGKVYKIKIKKFAFLVHGFEDETIDLIWFWFWFDTLNYQVHPTPQIWTGIFKSKSCIIFFHWLLQLIGSTFGAAKLQDEASALGGGPPVFRLGGFVVKMEEVEIMRISWKPTIYTIYGIC